jgi:ABC-type amino acid transport substrate-binding protein
MSTSFLTRSRARRSLAAGVAVVAALVMTACGSSDDKSTASAKADDGLMTSGTLVVGMNLQFKPEMYLDNGQPAGYDVDLLNALATSMGVKLQIKNLDFNGLIPGLQSKQFDIVSVGLTPNPDREKVIDFSRSYVPYASILAVNSTYSGAETVDAFNTSGTTITALQGSSDETLAKTSFPKAKVQGLSDQNATLLQVRTGRAQGAVLEDYILAQYLKTNQGTLREAKLSKPLSLSYGSWGVQKGNTTEDEARRLPLQGPVRRHARQPLPEGLRRHHPDHARRLLSRAGGRQHHL